jgi:hypothetical protein
MYRKKNNYADGIWSKAYVPDWIIIANQNDCLGAKLRIGVCQQTISKESSGETLSLQNGQPLTRNGEGEEIVESRGKPGGVVKCPMI